MATFKDRIPARKELFTVFLASAFASNAWALYNITQEVPAWILRLSLGEMVGVMAHSLLFALLDALPIFVALTLAAIVLPASWLRDRFVAIGSSVAFITAVWMIIFHTNNLLTQRDVIKIAVWAASYALITAVVYIWILRSDKANRAVVNGVERLGLLAGLYLVLDLVGIGVVLIRTLMGSL